MSETSVHPIYQHRYLDADGIPMVVNPEMLSPIVRAGHPLRYGYWRPHTFNELASLELGEGGALLDGILGERRVAASRYDGDPDVLLSEWLAYATAAGERDMKDRDDALLQRKVRDAAYLTRHPNGPESWGDVGVHPVAIRHAVQGRLTLVHGTWNNRSLDKEVARLTWQDDLSITFTATASKMTFPAPVDLDAVVGAWIAFVAVARLPMEFEESLAAAKASVRDQAS